MSDEQTSEPDILVRLADLHKQATTERSHYYTARVVRDAIREIAELRTRLAAYRAYEAEMRQ